MKSGLILPNMPAPVGVRKLYPPPPAGSVLYYPGYPPMGATIYDRSGAGNHGTIVGPVWTRLPSGLWYLDYDGTDDNVDLGDILDSLFAAVDGKFSFHTWLKPGATMINNMILGKHDTVNTQRQLYWRLTTGSVLDFAFYFTTGTTRYRIVTATTTAITDTTKWYCLDMTYDGSLDTNDGLDRVKHYVHGIAESTTLTTTAGVIGDIVDGTAHLGWGALLDINGAYATGAIKGGMALLHAVSGVRTQAQIANRFNHEKHLFGVVI